MSAGTATGVSLDRYAAGECSLVELARALGVTRREARAALDRGGITIRNPGRPAGSSALAGVLTEDYLRRELLGRRRRVAELAAEVGCTPKTVRRYLVALGLVDPLALARRAGSPTAMRPSDSSEDGRISEAILGPPGVGPLRRDAGPATLSGTGLSRDELWEAYVVQASSTTAIAAAAGCAPSTVARDLRRHGIPLRRRGGAPSPSVRCHSRRAGIRRAVLPADGLSHG